MASVIQLIDTIDWSKIQPHNPCDHNLIATTDYDPNCYTVNVPWTSGGPLNIISATRPRDRIIDIALGRFYDYGFIAVGHSHTGYLLKNYMS